LPFLLGVLGGVEQQKWRGEAVETTSSSTSTSRCALLSFMFEFIGAFLKNFFNFKMYATVTV
jgi:hypothetical protein